MFLRKSDYVSTFWWWKFCSVNVALHFWLIFELGGKSGVFWQKSGEASRNFLATLAVVLWELLFENRDLLVSTAYKPQVWLNYLIVTIFLSSTSTIVNMWLSDILFNVVYFVAYILTSVILLSMLKPLAHFLAPYLKPDLDKLSDSKYRRLQNAYNFVS